jgi:hypothetical protein
MKSCDFVVKCPFHPSTFCFATTASNVCYHHYDGPIFAILSTSLPMKCGISLNLYTILSPIRVLVAQMGQQ